MNINHNNKFVIEKFGVKLRFVEEEDAEFITKLRLDSKLGKYISNTSNSIEDQKEWIKRYKQRERAKAEFYFMCENVFYEKMGTTRLYDFRKDTFELGSWIFKREAGNKSIIADILTKEYAFDILGFNYCTFNVRKENKSVLNYHSKYTPLIVYENELDIGFKLDKETFEYYKKKFLKILL